MWNVPANTNTAPLNYYATPANYYTPPEQSQGKSTQRGVGLVLGGGLLGMLYYYRPVTKNEFVSRAFEETVKDTQEQMRILKNAQGLNPFGLSVESRAFLSSHNIDPAADSVRAKYYEKYRAINHPDGVLRLKQNLADNFVSLKKNPALRNNIEKRAFDLARQSNLHWGVGIGAAVGLLLALIL
jgi:hypothetical protein